MVEFLDEATSHRKAADTFEAQIEEILLEHSKDEPTSEAESEKIKQFGCGQTWGDIVHNKKRTAEERQRRALRYESWAGVIRDILEAASFG